MSVKDWRQRRRYQFSRTFVAQTRAAEMRTVAEMREHVTLGTLMLGLLLGAAIVGCKSTGGGTGESHTGDVRASFMWEQSAPTSGTLRATVTKPGSAAETYEGRFYQITRDTQVQTIGGLWDPGYPAWGGWPYWGPQPEDSFIEHYTGHVVANLAGPNGQRMRCHFQLNRSGEGMKGGGQGECQLPPGQTINAEFPPS
jgi:hypothetical protein